MATKSKTASATSSNFGVKGWIIMILTFFSILLMSNICYDSLNVTIPVFGSTFAQLMGAPESTGATIGMLYMFSTVAAWVSVIGAGLWGALCGKLTCRRTWAASLIVGAIGCLVWSQATNAVVYFIGLALSYVGGMGFAYIASLNVISNWFPRKKGLAMGWVTIGFPLSAVIATPLCSALLASLGLSGIYYLYAILCVVLAIIVFLYVRDYPEEKGAYPDNDASYDKAQAEAELKAGLEYMKTSPWTGKKLAVAGLLACVGSVLCGLLDAKVGPKKAIIITYIVAIISIVLNVVAGNIKTAGNEGLATVLFFISLPFLAIMLGGAANYLVSLTNTIWGRYDFPAAYRLLKPLVAVVGALGMTIVGGIGNAGPGYGVAYMVLGVLAVIGTVIMFTVDDSLVGRDR